MKNTPHRAVAMIRGRRPRSTLGLLLCEWPCSFCNVVFVVTWPVESLRSSVSEYLKQSRLDTQCCISGWHNSLVTLHLVVAFPIVKGQRAIVDFIIQHFLLCVFLCLCFGFVSKIVRNADVKYSPKGTYVSYLFSVIISQWCVCVVVRAHVFGQVCSL